MAVSWRLLQLVQIIFPLRFSATLLGSIFRRGFRRSHERRSTHGGPYARPGLLEMAELLSVIVVRWHCGSRNRAQDRLKRRGSATFA